MLDPTDDEWRPDAPLPPITRFELHTPFQVGTVNAYLVDDDPLTLVDCGPRTDAAWAGLDAALAAHGRRPADVGRVIITHAHVDHWGLAARLAALGGAEIRIHESLAHVIRDFPEEWQRRTAYMALFGAEMGVPPGEMLAINREAKALAHLVEPIAPARTLAAGETITLAGRPWTVHETPGHALGHIVLHQPDTRTLIAGDHLLPDVSSNPILEAPPPGTTARPRMLPLYIESLQRVADLPVLWVFPGHGRPFQGHRKLIKRRLALHESRAARLLEFLADGPADTYTLTRRLFPRLGPGDLFLGLSETQGHLDLLEDRGQVARGHGAGARRYAATAAPAARPDAAAS